MLELICQILSALLQSPLGEIEIIAQIINAIGSSIC